MDELKKALQGVKPISSGIGTATGDRGVFVYNKETRTMERFVNKKKLETNAPFIQRDEILDGVESPLTGEKYYSKSALRQHYKENGYRETGGGHLTGKAPERKKPDYREIREDVERALNDARWGNIPLSEKERQAIIEEERQWDYYRKRMR